jgi:ribosome-associated translation inhibitor RaiA
MQDETTRQPFAEATDVPHDSRKGASDAAHTPLQIRSLDGAVAPALHAWIHERLGRQLGKFATQIERIEVRFADENANKGGIDHTCLIHVVLSALPPLAVEAVANEQREAFDLAAGKTERALKHSLQKHGFSVRHRARHRSGSDDQTASSDEQAASGDGRSESAAESGKDEIDMLDSLYGRREGRGPDSLKVVQEIYNTELEHTAPRNVKLNTEGMTHDLEDSMNGRPSRKSTRRSKNGVKADSGLTLRTKSRMHTPENEAMRVVRRG